MSFEKNQDLFKALSNETSYRIIKALSKNNLCACELPEIISRTQSNTSMHLKKLTEQGILQNKRTGKKIIYSIKNKKAIDKLKQINLI